jgi:hypothetical protein
MADYFPVKSIVLEYDQGIFLIAYVLVVRFQNVIFLSRYKRRVNK